ncbi:hypothetical protein [Nannocystis punicea]|uniref:MYXO-CTERM domain-containing protein n=1 Tax=Nannocystis punicea TaxID=2995304 RepID=A0ABY7GSY8_9BACT|nr:hypothetical protein [Nannocystis poenicansa]WAS90073.1 hypothetical protein O0S08_28090 [Nannocystis poenicansa]
MPRSRPERWLIRVVMAGALGLTAAEARADIIPEPRRPSEWKETPPPMPEPPPEKELPTLPLVVLLAVAVATASALRLRQPAAQVCG